MRVAEKRMRIAALQYANGQVNHCDDLIDSSQWFFRVFKYIFVFINLTIYQAYAGLVLLIICSLNNITSIIMYGITTSPTH